MTYCHVAHDCRLGDKIIMSNSTQLGGHVEIEDWVILGGVVKVHQFCKIGCHAMVGADVKVVKDVPPYTLIGREPARVEGINKVGLRRRGFNREEIMSIEKFYDTILFSGLNTAAGITEFKNKQQFDDHVGHCIEFIESSSRGIYR
jgi:UDP-N-acetylglucosamine acyltransferase